MLCLAIHERKHFCVPFLVAIFLIPEEFLFFRVVFLRKVFHRSFEYLKITDFFSYSVAYRCI